MEEWPTPCSGSMSSTLSLDKSQIGVGKNEDHEKAKLKNSSEDMNDQTLDLFKKYLFARTTHNSLGKTNQEEEESEAIQRAPPRRLAPPKFDGGFRPPSLLERALLPGISGNNATIQSSSGEKASTAQLTIFYGGVINVYDDVPLHQAQAIMLLAGEGSLSTPIISNVPEKEVKKPRHRLNLPSICKLQADLPIARKYSLQRFLEKRRGRVNKSPYASSETRNDHEDDHDEPTTHDLLMMNEKGGSFIPSPFPSRFEYSLSISSQRTQDS